MNVGSVRMFDSAREIPRREVAAEGERRISIPDSEARRVRGLSSCAIGSYALNVSFWTFGGMLSAYTLSFPCLYRQYVGSRYKA